MPRNTMQYVTRFAPSPTGFLHAGNYRTAVFAYLFARHVGGTFILRIEDTDKKRSKKEYEANIIETLEWLGIQPDAVHHQSEWVKDHERVLREFVDRDIAYVSKETNAEGVENEVIRFRNPKKEVTFTDVVRGDITMDTSELGDFVIGRSFTDPVFHLANVVDDALQGATHIIRGEDHISNTPRQILLYEALNAHMPQFVHLPLVLASDRSKLSKRKGARALLEYRDLGYLPDAILNYLAMLGWHPGTDEEIFSKEELIERFSLEQVQKSGAIYDEVKLRWYNREHMLRMNDESFKEHVAKFLSETTLKALHDTDRFETLLPVIKERIETFEDVAEMERADELGYFVKAPNVDVEKLVWKKDPSPVDTKVRLEKVSELLGAISGNTWSAESVKNALWDYAEAEGKGSVLWPFRFSLTGREKSPDPFTVAGILGKDETISRVNTAISLL